MATWKKIIVSGSNVELNNITSSGDFESIGANRLLVVVLHQLVRLEV